MYDERGQFSMGEVLDEINAKLIRRHPHVFGNVKADKAEEALKNWERVKVDIEGRRPANSSTIDGVSRSLPPLERAYKLQRKAAKKGFDWPGPEGPREKILEELDEITASANDVQREEEVGDPDVLRGKLREALRHRSGSCAAASQREIREKDSDSWRSR